MQNVQSSTLPTKHSHMQPFTESVRFNIGTRDYVHMRILTMKKKRITGDYGKKHYKKQMESGRMGEPKLMTRVWLL